MEQYDCFLTKLVTQLVGAEKVHKSAWEADTYGVGGKIFAIRGTNKQQQPVLTLKGPPAQNEELIESNPAVTPGYHMNKTHWISLQVESDLVNEALVVACFETAYKLVFKKLTKKQQQLLLADLEL